MPVTTPSGSPTDTTYAPSSVVPETDTTQAVPETTQAPEPETGVPDTTTPETQTTETETPQAPTSVPETSAPATSTAPELSTQPPASIPSQPPASITNPPVPQQPSTTEPPTEEPTATEDEPESDSESCGTWCKVGIVGGAAALGVGAAVNIDERRRVFNALSAERLGEVGPTRVTPEELSPGEAAMVPAAWVEALTDLSVVPELWRRYVPSMSRVSVWLERSLVGVFLARTRMPIVDPMIGDPEVEVADVITLEYVVPDCLEMEDLSAFDVMSGAPPWLGGLPEYWLSMAAATGDFVTGLHNGFVGVHFSDVLPVQAFHSVYDHWDHPENVAFRDEDGAAVVPAPDMCELVVVAERGPIVALDPNRTDGLGWYGDTGGGFQLVPMVMEMEDMIAYSAGAHFYDPVFA